MSKPATESERERAMIHPRCEGCGRCIAPHPTTPDGRGHLVANEDGSPGYCGPISDYAVALQQDLLEAAESAYRVLKPGPSGLTHTETQEVAEKLFAAILKRTGAPHISKGRDNCERCGRNWRDVVHTYEAISAYKETSLAHDR